MTTREWIKRFLVASGAFGERASISIRSMVLYVLIGCLAAPGAGFAGPIPIGAALNPDSVFIPPIYGLIKDFSTTLFLAIGNPGQQGTVHVSYSIDARGSTITSGSLIEDILQPSASQVLDFTSDITISAATLNGIEPEGNATIQLSVDASADFTAGVLAAAEPSSFLVLGSGIILLTMAMVIYQVRSKGGL
jgi:hypothetical protein